jgi:hypothetical protein
MARPPTDIEPSALFLKLTERPWPTEVVPYPRDEQDCDEHSVRIRVLLDEEIEGKKIEARRWVQKTHKMTDAELDSDVGQRMVSDRVAKEILAMAVLDVKPIPGSEEHKGYPIYPRVFINADALGKVPPREISVLWGMWNLVQNRIGPNEDNMSSDEEVEHWVKVLTEGGRPFGFFLLDLPQQEALVSRLVSLADQLLVLLNSPQEDWQNNLESIRDSWDSGTSYSTSPVANSTLSQSQSGISVSSNEDLSADEAEQKAKDFLRRGRMIASEMNDE